MEIKTLAFVASARHAEALMSATGTARAIRIATFDVDLLCRLRSGGWDVFDLWSLLGPTEARTNDRLAEAACARLVKMLKDRCVIGAYDVVENLQYNLYHILLYVLNARTMIVGALEQCRPARILRGNEMSQSVWWDDLNPAPVIFNSVASWSAKRLGLKDEFFTCNPGPDGERKRRDNQESRNHQAGVPSAVRIIDFIGNIGFAEQGLLFDDLAIHGAEGWLGFSDDGYAVPFPQVSQSQVIKLPFDLKEIDRKVDELRRDGFPGGVFDDPELRDLITSEPLSFVWHQFCEMLKLGARWYAAGLFLCAAYRPRLLILGFETSGLMRSLVEAFHAEGCLSLSINHSGTCEDISSRKFTGAKGCLAVLGDYELRSVSRFRGNDGRIFKVGTLRKDLEFLWGSDREIEQTGNKAPVTSKVILFTATVGDMDFLFASPKKHVEGWAGLLEVCRRHADIDFAIKPHPRYDYHGLYGTSEFTALPNLRVLNIPAAEALRDASVAVTVNYSGTVALEAIAKKVPVIYFRQALLVENHEDLLDGAVVVESAEEFERVLVRLLSDRDYRAEVIRKQQVFLRAAVTATGQDAVRNVTTLIEDLCSRVKPAKEPDAAARWVLDMIMALNDGMAFPEAPHEFRRSLALLCRAGEVLPLESLQLIQPGKLGECFLHMVVYEPWPKNRQMSLPGAVWAVYRSLPRSIRPGLNVLRVYLVHAAVAESELAEKAGRKSTRYNWLACLLAPDRLRTLLGRPITA